MRYLIVSGFVVSRNDKQLHRVSASRLIRLYGVNHVDCVIMPDSDNALGVIRRRHLMEAADRGEYIVLSPRDDGNYTLPTKDPKNGPH